jgi:hypothetical protein
VCGSLLASACVFQGVCSNCVSVRGACACRDGRLYLPCVCAFDLMCEFCFRSWLCMRVSVRVLLIISFCFSSGSEHSSTCVCSSVCGCVCFGLQCVLVFLSVCLCELLSRFHAECLRVCLHQLLLRHFRLCVRRRLLTCVLQCMYVCWRWSSWCVCVSFVFLW